MIIGITGGSGAGKTTLLRVLQERGAFIIDCDEVYRELLRTNTKLLAELSDEFPGTVQDGVLDRKALGAIVFADPKKLSRLNAIAHRYVRDEVDRLINSEFRIPNSEFIAIDAIALIESGRADNCDFVIAVCAPTAERVRRLTAREGISEEYALARIAAQKSDDWFEAHADAVLYNSGTEAEFTLKCNALLDGLLNSANI